MVKIAFTLSILLLSASSASSDIFRYTDENGVTCYTDMPAGKKAEKIIDNGTNKDKQQVMDNVPAAVSGDYTAYVHRAASKYDLEPELIHAVIRTESNGNHRAVSKKGAIGLMQLMPSTASDMNVNNPFNPEDNIDGGTKYLKSLLEKFNGDLTLALAAYNAGPKTVEKYGNVPPISETRQYVKKVLSLFKGKKSYNVSTASAVSQEVSLTVVPSPVRKILLDDGSVLFTNSTLSRTGKVRF